jgi:hypothetical protein
MKRCHSLFLVVLAPVLIFGTLILATDAVPQDDAKKAETKPAKETCLACHGPFDKLAASTADYETPSGEKTSPHKYIPHADKKDIPDCNECHTPHPVPIQDVKAVVKANIDYCYTACHHAHNLQACSTCH